MTKVTANKLSKKYPNGYEALKDVSFEVSPGEFLIIVGPSGCGKSTLLRAIAGLEDITSGEILFDGRKINDEEPKNRDVGMVFQNYALYPHLSIRDNIAFPLKIKGENKKVIADRVKEVAAMLQLDSQLDKKPKELSGGQRQRVALGRAIARKPKVFLFDEPLSNLDAKLRVQMRTEISRLQKELGITSVYVTHDQAEAMTMGDKIIVMDNGAVQQIGTPDEIYHSPANIFVAGFLGTPQINFFNSGYSDGKLLLEDFSMPFPVDPFAGKKAFTAALRPEDITIEEGSANKVTVQTVEKMGHETLLYFDHEGGRGSIRISGKSDIGEGDSIGIGFRQDKILFFDEQGKRI